MQFHIAALCKTHERTEQGGTRLLEDLPKAPPLSALPREKARRKDGRLQKLYGESLTILPLKK